MIIEVKQFGDFDILQTHSVWEGESLPQTFREANYCQDSTPERLIKCLEASGFRRVRTKSIKFGGAL